MPPAQHAQRSLSTLPTLLFHPHHIMAPAAAPAAKEKKEKLFHPASRKAGQLARNALRKGKLGNLASKRSTKHHSLVDLYGFFFFAMPDDRVLALPELHALIADVWLTRHDDALAAEVAARRKGRPKSTAQQKLEDIKLREAEVYRTGMGASLSPLPAL